jgi:hypothetical protein
MDGKELLIKVDKILDGLGEVSELDKNLEICKKMAKLKKAHNRLFCMNVIKAKRWREFADRCGAIVLMFPADWKIDLFVTEAKTSKRKLNSIRAKFARYRSNV